MVFLKEDGSLDIERINKLPLEEYWDMMGCLTEEQVMEYNRNLSINENRGSIKVIVADRPLEEYGVDAEEVLNNLKKECMPKFRSTLV